MKANGKLKLNLIDNYIAIYRILYYCKHLLTAPTNYSKTEVENIQAICDQTLDLKSKYENAFKELKMIDNSFLLLKQQLNDCKHKIFPKQTSFSISDIFRSIETIKTTYSKIQF
ncbi:MAG: hypothetical protein IJW59_00770 [Clostridia bacterium]|nr:hypothetical protein [Clostridia bacterium]